jgi:CDP-diacylglycerol--glycerol-3-phosphate 3-phosphatidyltransferase
MVRLIDRVETVLNIANALSLIRLMLGPFFMLAVFNGKYVGGFVLLLIAALTDFLDGKLARVLGIRTRTGKMLDPLADKVIIFFAVLTLLIEFKFPLWLGLIMILRDAILLVGGAIFLYKNKKKYFVPNLLGKITTFMQMSTLLIYIVVHVVDRYFVKLLNVFQPTLIVLLLLTAFFTVVSGAVYIVKGYGLFFKIKKRQRKRWTNIPNKITLARIIFIPLFIVFLMSKIPYKNSIAAALFIILALSDALDGYIARKSRQTTRLGSLIDPLADKLLVSSALIFLIPTGIPAWMVYTIIAREFIITGLRTLALSRNYVLPARFSGKVKTVSQVVAISAVLLNMDLISNYLMWIAVVITVYSGVEYLWAERKLFKELI